MHRLRVQAEAAPSTKVELRPVLAAAGSVVVIGSVFLDHVSDAAGSGPASSGSLSPRQGGIGRNVAEHLGWLGIKTTLLCLVSPDPAETVPVTESLERAGVRIVAKTVPGGIGHFFGRLRSDGEVDRHRVAQPPIEQLDWHHVREHLGNDVPYLVVETGLDEDMLGRLLQHLDPGKTRTFGLPTRLKEVGPRRDLLRRFHSLLLNHHEASYLVGRPLPEPVHGSLALRELLDEGISQVLITFGRAGLVAGTRGGEQLVCPAPAAQVISTLGAGDALAAGFIAAMASGYDLSEAVHLGQLLAHGRVEGKDPALVAARSSGSLRARRPGSVPDGQRRAAEK